MLRRRRAMTTTATKTATTEIQKSAPGTSVTPGGCHSLMRAEIWRLPAMFNA